MALVYAAGCIVLKENVREACTHGNCRHGFYSKYTKAEQAALFAWLFGYPAAVLAATAAAGVAYTALFDRKRSADRVEVVAATASPPRPAPAPPPRPVPPRVPTWRISCPECGEQMVLRTARRGPRPGTSFGGCPRFPYCRGTRPYSGEGPAV